MAVRGRIYIEMVPDPAIVAETFFATAQRCQTLDEPLRMCVDIAREEFAANWAAQGRPEGWAPLSDSTIWSRTLKSLNKDQRANLYELKKNAAFEGELVEGAGGQMHFVPAPSSKFQMVMSGLTSEMQILVDTGDLQRGAQTVDWGERSFGFSSQAVEMTDPTGYGYFHVTGTVHMPQRDWTYISEEAKDSMATIMADWVAESNA